MSEGWVECIVHGFKDNNDLFIDEERVWLPVRPVSGDIIKYQRRPVGEETPRGIDGYVSFMGKVRHVILSTFNHDGGMFATIEVFVDATF